jgi:hypothetical protein
MNPKPSISRREFIQTGTFLATAASLGRFAPANSGEGMAMAERPGWFDKPMRWGQLTLVEDDPGKYEPGFWLDYFKDTHCDAVCLSAGGCLAFYPTKVPMHHRSAWLGDADPFGELVAGCRKLGMIVVARTDPHATYQDVYEAHPDWIAVTADGKKRRHWASPEMWVACGLGPYNFSFMTEVTKEIMSLYMVDGIFINRWDGSGMCYCEHCQALFKAASGLDLPRTNNPQDPARRSYILWRQKRLFELWQLWESEVRKINPNACVIPNTGGGALSSLDMKQIGGTAEVLVADRQARRGMTVPWANGKHGKEYRAAMGRKPIIGLFSVGLEEPYRWKDSVQSAAELRIWVLDGIANGLRPWFSKFSGTLHDRRWLPVVRDLFHWHYRNEKYLRQEAPLARVAMVYSQQTATFYGGDRARSNVEDHTLGMYHALIEARVPFEMVHDRLLEPDQINQFKLLILPNIAALSDQQCAQIRAYVTRGGSILATHETSLYNEWGQRRTDFGLADLFGVSFTGQVEGPMQNSYLRLERDRTTGQAHPILAGLEDAPRIINGVWRVEVEPRARFQSTPLTLIPSYPDLPMEKVYPRQPHTNLSQVFLRQIPVMGEPGILPFSPSNPQPATPGRIVYFPWDIDRVFWEVMCVDHGLLLRNAVEWAVNEEKPVTVAGPGVLDVTVWRQKDSMTVHLVNLTNPMMMKGPFREFIPLSEQKVRVRLPSAGKPKKVHLLVANITPPATVMEGFLEVRVPSILDHEILAIDL